MACSCNGLSMIWRRRLPALRFRSFGLRCFSDAVSSDSVDSGKSGSSNPERSAERTFRDPRVQASLRRLINHNIDKVYKTKLKKLKDSEIKLMTAKELEEYTTRKMRELDDLLQIPPVMDARADNIQTLEKEPLLQDFDTHRHVFTDITYGVKHRDRHITVRETDGTLRTASWDERDRMIQIYFPQEGRELDLPKVFEDEFLKEALNKGFYTYLLDRACVQFEPDDPHFIRVCRAVFRHIDENRAYSVLDSTRHLGSLIFHLAFNDTIDNYLTYLLQHMRLEDAGRVLSFYQLVHSGQEAAAEDPVQAIKDYIGRSDAQSTSKARLELALQGCVEKMREQEASAPEVDEPVHIQPSRARSS